MEKAGDGKTPFRYLWHYIRIFKLLVVSVLALNFLSQLCGQVYPLYLAKIYSTAAGEVGTPDYWDKIVGFALAAFVLGLGKVIFLTLPCLSPRGFCHRCGRWLSVTALTMLTAIP